MRQFSVLNENVAIDLEFLENFIDRSNHLTWLCKIVISYAGYVRWFSQWDENTYGSLLSAALKILFHRFW